MSVNTNHTFTMATVHIPSSLQTDAMQPALRFAMEKHRGVFRKNEKALPYVTHPIGVAERIVLAGGGTLSILQAALLHDTIEDTKTTYEEIVEAFGKETADIVREVTDDRSLSKVDRKRAQIEKAKKMSHAAKLVKLADKLDNLTDLAEDQPKQWTAEQCQGYFVWAMTVVEQMRGTCKLLEKQLDRLAKRDFIYKKTDQSYPCIPKEAREDMEAAVEHYYTIC